MQFPTLSFHVSIIELKFYFAILRFYRILCSFFICLFDICWF